MSLPKITTQTGAPRALFLDLLLWLKQNGLDRPNAEIGFIYKKHHDGEFFPTFETRVQGKTFLELDALLARYGPRQDDPMVYGNWFFVRDLEFSAREILAAENERPS